MVGGVLGRVLAVSPRVSDRLPVRPPVLDGQRMNPRLHVLATAGKRDLLARRAPTTFTRAKLDWLMRVVTTVRTGPVRTSSWTIAGPAGLLAARLYQPERGSRSLLMFVHGGGWHVGSVAGYENTLRFLADRAGVSVLSVDYRLAPEHPFPAAFDDVSAAFRYAVDHAEQWGIDTGRIGIGGDSAGGNLAAAVALTLAPDARYRPAVVALLYPALDWTLDRYQSTTLFTVPLDEDSVRRAMRWYAPTTHAQEDPRFSVLSGDLSVMPRTYVATAGMDVLRDQGETLVTRLRGLGVDAELRRFDNLPHGFASMLVDPQARSATGEYARAVGSILAQRVT